MNYREKIFDLESNFPSSIIDGWKNENKTIVFTNGCFDILHSGHIDYLNEAKKQGDKLIIGLNSDLSVKRLKGDDRPVKDQQCRADVLAFMGEIDLVIIFGDDTPYQLINKIKPDILVKGGDWPVSEIVGADIVLKNGGKVISLKFLEGYSSTKYINKILESSEKTKKH